MQIPIPIFEWTNMTIFPDTFWGGFLFTWLLLGFVQLSFMYYYRKRKANIIGETEGLLDEVLIFLTAVIMPFIGVYVALSALKDKTEMLERTQTKAQLKKRKK